MALTRVLFITFFTTVMSSMHLSVSKKTVDDPETRTFLGFGTTSLTQRPCNCLSTVFCSCCETVKIFYTGEAKRLCFNMIYQTNGLNFDLSLDTLMLKSMTVANYRPFQMCATVPGLLFSSICVSILELNQFPRSFTICPRVDVIAKPQRWYITYICSSISNQLPGTPAMAGGGMMATVPAAMGMMMAGAGTTARPGAAAPPAAPAMAAAPTGARPAGAMPAAMMPAGMMPTGMMPAGMMPPGMMPPGMMPTGMMPAGMMPPGMMPPGMMPTGMMPAGMMPPGMMPAGMMPVGMMPGGAPTGQRPAGAPAPMTPAAPMPPSGGSPPPGGSPAAGGAAPPGGSPAAGGAAPPGGAQRPGAPPPGAMAPAGTGPSGVIMPRPGGPPMARLVVSAELTENDDEQQLVAENGRGAMTFEVELTDVPNSDVSSQFSYITEPVSEDDNNNRERRQNMDAVVKTETIENERAMQTENNKNDVILGVLKREKRQAYDMFDLFHQSNRCEKAYRICITRSRHYIVSRMRNSRNGPKTKNNCFDKPARIVYGSAENLCAHINGDTESEEVTLSSISEAADPIVQNNDSSLEAIVVHDEPTEGADVYPQSSPYIIPITSYNRQDNFPMRTPPLFALQIKQKLSRSSNDTLIFSENAANNFNNQDLLRPAN